MDMKQLHCFITVVEQKSITKAADKLYITQPAMSRIIKSLEEELGTGLFIRSRKQLQITSSGKVIYPYIKNIIDEYESMQTDLDELTGRKKAHLRIGLPTVSNIAFFSTIMAEFHQSYPDVTFELMEDGSKRIEEKVMEGKLDFGVVYLPTKHQSFDYLSLGQEQLRLVVSRNHLLANQDKVKLSSLKDENFIMFSNDFALRDTVYEACREVGFEPNVSSETTQLDFVEEMVASQLGITLLPESTLTKLKGHVVSIELDQLKIEWSLALIWRKGMDTLYMHREFIRFVKANL
ncbi:LysR family transcriptional regulator [Oceanobacillus kimchii]|uniref:LysR family transcriptional regulator n=1 Tax=Oceanobacillus TaxID=182709 RepID=UPI00034559A4|nr:LysR family transcriptional regulator [Oceanobacillus kimchii]MCT1576801.1 LysR family transcriptional regulator [Oceanobacillus kimchii]MCT2134871.1 LysR family transcriptional regulator [Oceanobacillus kimchii]